MANVDDQILTVGTKGDDELIIVDEYNTLDGITPSWCWGSWFLPRQDPSPLLSVVDDSFSDHSSYCRSTYSNPSQKLNLLD
jgi:hypothetical protein